jgi:signal transduction histidine kinase
VTASDATRASETPDVPATILIVDDQERNLIALEAVLEDLHVPLVRATSGEEALLRVLEQDFALIILDVQMPGLDGLETAKLIKTRGKSAHIPIIFITALSREAAYVFKGYAEGAVDYLLKPIDPEIVRAKASVFVELFRRGERIKRDAALVAASEAKDAFIGAVSHEMRTPLTAAKAQAQLAIRQLGDTGGSSKKALGLIARQIDRVIRLVEELLDMTRLQSGKLVLRPQTFDLEALSREVAERMGALSDKHRLQVSCDAPVWITADQDRVDQILTNLISNALRYSPDGGPVELALFHRAEMANIAVADQGVGIPGDRLEAIFERFAQAHGPTFGGIGLGLAITRELVRLHGGKIWAESKGLGRGATFHVVLPSRPPGSDA